MIAAHAFDPILAGLPAQLVGDNGRILPVAPQRWLAPADGEEGLWRGAARLQVAGCAAGPWFPWAVAELPVLATLATLAGFQVADRYRADRCFAELRYVSGR